MTSPRRVATLPLMFKASLRIDKISSTARLREASWSNPARNDQRRLTGVGAVEDFTWSKSETTDDLLAAFEAHKIEFGARERRNAPLALRIVCMISPNRADQANEAKGSALPRRIRLLEHSVAWAESWGGTSSVFATRLHPDSKSGMELLIAPVRESRGKPVISTHKALRELKERLGERNEYAALQTSWADWCAAYLDPAMIRGTPRHTGKAEQTPADDSAPGNADDAAKALWRDLSSQRPSLDSIEILADLLLLKREILRHKAEGAAYTPPKGTLSLDHRAVIGSAFGTDPWQLIETIRSDAYQVTEAACRFGMGLDDNTSDTYEAGRTWFPDHSDRMHLAAAVAKCGAFCAQVEAEVKNTVFSDGPDIDPCTRWPHGAAREVLRHETNLQLMADVLR